MTNRLAHSTSPYLLQHAENPVEWWEWGDEAFAEARRRGVPVFLSVGYSSCHWCHVLAHESFEDEAVAAFMNEHFVSVKVDREERPDVDAVYMTALQAATGQGGWPMSVFLTPDQRPFYFGTYYPPKPRHGMPSFTQVLQGVAEAWRTRRDEVGEAAQQITGRLAEASGFGEAAGDGPPGAADLHTALLGLAREYDAGNGGFGGAPKFPPSMVLEFLLRHRARTGSDAALEMAEHTCAAMARGGLHDQLGGGFARYAVDATWTVPHFEKMLYDNALLLRVYTHLWRLTGDPEARRVALGAARFLMDELRTADGGFASALDADSEGGEGAFYVWTPEQLAEVLGAEDGARAAALFGVTEEGTFEHGASVLRWLGDGDADTAFLESVRGRLLTAREARPRPGRDDKVVAAWNGLAIAALAEAGALFGRPELVDAAVAAADLLVGVHLDERGRLRRTSRDGAVGASPGVLEDYGDVAEGLLTLYGVTGEAAWLSLAGALLGVVLEEFADGEGGFHDTAASAERLIVRPQDPTDNAAPSGWTAAAGALLTYAAYTGSSPHREAAERALGVVSLLAARAPRFAGWGLAVAEAALDGPREVAVVGAVGGPLHAVALAGAAPGLVVAVGEGDAEGVPLLAGRTRVGGAETAYVCRGFVCEAPTADAEALAASVGPSLG
ncbi:hypothetical protein BIV57_03495 [Mangrovactinospora gilvigrisea]|uniref:Spermatogenesis-associated protein 20-like TRX domain-containing protein n=1 Tax=Mangrovactinospora gilvigrisea TaxID=1428644 RepID=A0A1J7CGM8_9ACTN|nr:thioredoxin domain-containing protein [Mangrovactinospora gilvigrisea]OIV38818.1 hypothetical protein BIV57_03495 [Mangrovactinospora gilvigrisea]